MAPGLKHGVVAVDRANVDALCSNRCGMTPRGGENETTPRQHGVPGRNRLRHSQSLVGPGIFMLQDFWGFPKV